MPRPVSEMRRNPGEDEPDGLPAATALPIWLISACAALALHAGSIAAAAYYAKPVEVQDDLGAPAVEVGIEFAAPHLQPVDLPPGPPADDAVATPAVVAQKANVEETQLPTDQPIESDDPDRLVTPDNSSKPKEDDPTIKAVEAMPSEESIASEAAAPPVDEAAKESQQSTAPVEGTGESETRVVMTWERELGIHLNKHKRYPTGAKSRNAQVTLSFTIDRLGHLVSANVVTSSGDSAFDQAAVAMMHNADPVPAPPAVVADKGLTFTLPVIFKPHGGN
jgi:periplasmic protein TonB